MGVARGLHLWPVTPHSGLSLSECDLAQGMVTRPRLGLELLHFPEGSLLVILF